MYFYRLYFQRTMIIVKTNFKIVFVLATPLIFSPEKDPKAPGLATYHALTAICRPLACSRRWTRWA
jgi:hypothetical protein